MMVMRTIVHIDEELCDGCGACVSPCAEGALILENGKAKVIQEELCDGAGVCLAVCPTGALTLESRLAEAFSEEAVEKHQAEKSSYYIPQHCVSCNISEDDAYLLAIKNKGRSMWFCTRCLPRLIHG